MRPGSDSVIAECSTACYDAADRANYGRRQAGHSAIAGGDVVVADADADAQHAGTEPHADL